MSRKIIGVTVGTPISPRKIEQEIEPVKTVNGKKPDENGNVDVVCDGYVLSEADIKEIADVVLAMLPKEFGLITYTQDRIITIT